MNETDKEFECPVCLKEYETGPATATGTGPRAGTATGNGTQAASGCVPMLLTKCGHSLCLVCIRQLSPALCPHCRVTFDPRSDTVKHLYLERLIRNKGAAAPPPRAVNSGVSSVLGKRNIELSSSDLLTYSSAMRIEAVSILERVAIRIRPELNKEPANIIGTTLEPGMVTSGTQM